MFGNITDDEDTFLPTSSNLASVFGVTNTSTDNTFSLTYTAPKQPTTNKVGEPKPNRVQSSLITFKEVHAFKLIDKNYINLGRCGFAFIGNESIKTYQLLIYKQKNDIICSVKFSPEFQFNERADNYATFFDDEKINWTVHFATDFDLKEFSQAIKSHGGKITKNIDTKNVSPLTKNIATSTVERKNTSIISQQKPKENKETDFEEFINKIDSEFSDSSNSNAKATLLSRMAKMGQKLLPNNNISDGTDSDTEKERKKTMPNRRTKRSGTSTPATTTTTTPPLSDIQANKTEINKTLPISLPSSTQAYTFMNGQYVPIIQSQFMQPSPFHNQIPVENVPSPIMYSLPTQQPSDQLQMYFTENRTHNSEVRMNILRLTDKMEQVLSKINTYESSKNISTTVETPEIIEALKKENEKLRTNVEKLQKQIERYKELEQKHTELLEQQIPLIKSNDEMKNIIAAQAQTEMKYLTKITELDSIVTKQKDDLKQYEINSREKVDIDETIKKLLNSLYSDISNQIGDDDTIFGRDIKKTLAQKFVDNAYSIIAVVSSDTSKREKSENLE